MINLSSSWEQAHTAFGVIILILSSYSLLVEAKKLVVSKRISVGNLTYLAFEYAVVILTFREAKEKTLIIVTVILILMAYVQLFLSLALFDKTAVLITTAFYIVKDMMMFALIFFIMVIGFGNAFYIVAGLQKPEDDPFSGQNLGLAFFYSYSMVLGNFDTTELQSLGKDQWIALFCLLGCTWLGSVVLLNMIIAIMNDTYDSVMQSAKEERLMTKCSIL